MPRSLAQQLVSLLTALALVPLLSIASAQQIRTGPATPPSSAVLWRSAHAEHAYGLPDARPHQKGVLTLDQKSFTFTGKSFHTSIPRDRITAVSAGNDRVEMWGTGGRVMRMVIPDGGGLAAAAVMHHRVDMLTLDFRDARGGSHSAVFYLPATEADLALKSFGDAPPAPRLSQTASCSGKPLDPRGVLVDLPDWDRAQVPAAYRALVYEHVIARLKAAKGVGNVYRAGELGEGTACPQFTIKIAIDAYKKGNQVVRAATGPIGMFTSATQMTFDVAYTDAASGVTKQEKIKAAVRTESESTGVADAVAKKLAKKYVTILKASASSVVSAPNSQA
ncbi:hypothetical protein [Edaphobacter dinghuensis]|uniref:Uncharacterized protein n=1 Tax=Edaphobacter dinghuensis TaxID=1560005 RepID=A0A917H4E0_9BACT|nr:hypothetical protein [Edaphobacter dinghuensis]GGG66847.1 hypothetical protein GCM10011585_05880 [Edaphobacter dinghuensis]